MSRRIGLGSFYDVPGVVSLRILPHAILEYIADIVKEAMASTFAFRDSWLAKWETIMVREWVDDTRYFGHMFAPLAVADKQATARREIAISEQILSSPLFAGWRK